MTPEQKRMARKLVIGSTVVLGLAGAWFVLAFKNKVPGAPIAWELWERARNQQRMLGFLVDNRRVPPGAVVFLGSSSVVRFPVEHLFDGPIVNRGLGSEYVMQMVARIGTSLPATRPSGFILWAGANDLRALAEDPPLIVERLSRALDELERRVPGVPFAIVGVTPYVEQTASSRDRLRRLNDGYRALAFARGGAYIDPLRAPLVDENLCLRSDMADPDGLHLGRKGYEVLARWIAEEGGPATAALALAVPVPAGMEPAASPAGPAST